MESRESTARRIAPRISQQAVMTNEWCVYDLRAKFRRPMQVSALDKFSAINKPAKACWPLIQQTHFSETSLEGSL